MNSLLNLKLLIITAFSITHLLATGLLKELGNLRSPLAQRVAYLTHSTLFATENCCPLEPRLYRTKLKFIKHIETNFYSEKFNCSSFSYMYFK